ncbi:MAG: helix-turn-helix domain-containing protein [Cytophagaceae bacterium]|nr:helix-turn-helix domain-containing protein [Cytophagaceae bacterium]
MIIVQLDSEELSNLIQQAVHKAIAETPKATNPTETDRWFDLTDLCLYLPDKPAKATAYGWVHHGLIPCHKGQKKLRFLKSEIDQWLKTGRKKTVAEIEASANNYLSSKKS